MTAPGPAPAPSRGRRRRVVVVALLAVVLVIVVSSRPLHEGLISLLTSAQSVIVRYPIAGPAVFVVLSALSAMLAFMSSAILVPVGVQTWGAERCIAMPWVGWMLGGLASYGLARGLGGPIIRRLGAERALADYQHRITRNAPFGVVLLFQLALPSELPGYVLGLAGYPLSRYLAALALVELPYAVGTVLLGAGLVERKLGWIVVLGSAAVLTAVLSIRALQRRLPAGPSSGAVS